MYKPQSIAGKKILYFAGTEDIISKAGGESSTAGSIWPEARSFYGFSIANS
jgi:hypothetical protein